MDAVRIKRAGVHDFFYLDDRDFRRRGHVRIEITGRLAEHEVTRGIGPPGFDDRKIRSQPCFTHIELAVEFFHRLALGHDGADPGAGVEGRNPGPAGTDSLGQRALRIQLQLQLASEIKLLEQFVLADIRGDHFADLTVIE